MSIDTSKIIHAPVGGGRYTVTAPIVKEDYGLYLLIEGLELPETYQVDFSNSEHNGTSVTMIGNSDGVLIPNQFISSGKDVFAFLYHVGDNYGRTVFKFRIPNKLRPDRTDDVPTPEEQSIIDQAISALNTAVAQTAQDVIDADQSAQDSASSAQDSASSALSASDSAERASASATSAQTSASQASASATASAQSASEAQSASTNAETYALNSGNKAVESAQSATASANSASQASASATSASQSATSAQGYASQAQTSAQTASTKASEASTSAGTASAKATESAQSASQALTYKTDAEQAKTASQTAQASAEQAKTDAISAKEDAESARDEAQSIVDGISAKAEQIDSNTERIESLEDDRYKPYAVDSASGAIASFVDGADDIPLKSLIVNIDPVQDTSSGDPSPENICPISGWTEVDVEQSGVNIWDEEYISGGISATGGVYSVTSVDARIAIVLCKPNTTYTATKFESSNRFIICSSASYPTVGTTLTNYYNSSTSNPESKTFTTDANARYIVIGVTTSSEKAEPKMQIQFGSTDHSYHPYTGRSITIDLGQTVYGGKLDVLSGVMRVDRGYIDLATLSGWVNNMLGQNAIEIRCTLTGKKEGRTNIISDMLKTGTETSTTDVAAYSVRGFLTSASIAVKAPKAVVTDSSGLVAWIGENHPTVCYELATPIEIQLDAHTINSLYGQNNIFADTGETACEYRADTTLYISRLTEPDADMIADANITSGKYFMVGNNLYLATANIASGSAVIVGTNAIRKSLSEALNEINS